VPAVAAAAATAAAIAPSSAAAPAGAAPAAGWFPTGATATAADDGEPRSPFPSTGSVAVVVETASTEDDEPAPPARRRHPYTWLHLIVLAIVAFVLGFLIVALWNQGRDGAADEPDASAAVLVGHAPPATL
jgi:hypothetical protein